MSLIDEVIARLEQAQHEARAFVIVTVDNETQIVMHASGPYVDAENALIQTVTYRNEDAKDEEPDGFSYVVVPLWRPAE